MSYWLVWPAECERTRGTPDIEQEQKKTNLDLRLSLPFHAHALYVNTIFVFFKSCAKLALALLMTEPTVQSFSVRGLSLIIHIWIDDDFISSYG